MIPGGIMGAIANPSAGVIFFLLGFLFVSAHEGIEIDEAGQKYRKYNSLLFLKTGGWKKYDQFLKIFVNPVKTSQEIYTRVNTTSTIRNVELKAYLKKSDDEKIYLMSHKNKVKLFDRLLPLSKYLELEIVDNSI